MLAGTGPAGPDSRGRRYHAEWLHHALVEGTARWLVWSWCHRVRGHTPHWLGAALSNDAAHAEEQGHRLWRHACHTCQDVWRREVHQGSFWNWCRPHSQMKCKWNQLLNITCRLCGWGVGVMWLGVCHCKWEKDRCTVHWLCVCPTHYLLFMFVYFAHDGKSDFLCLQRTSKYSRTLIILALEIISVWWWMFLKKKLGKYDHFSKSIFVLC